MKRLAQGWEKAINARRVDKDCDIYITGSNAFLLSSEIATLISGRYVEIRMHPLSFSEYLDFLGPTEITSRYAVFGKEEITPIDELLDPRHRISVRHPSGWRGPAFLIGDDKDLILWGFTAGVIARLFDFLDWARPWDENVMPVSSKRSLPPTAKACPARTSA